MQEIEKYKQERDNEFKVGIIEGDIEKKLSRTVQIVKKLSNLSRMVRIDKND